MAIKNSSSTQSLMITIISIFLLLAHNVKSFSFTFPSFANTNGIDLQGDAFTSNGAIHLTSALVHNSAGRASYASPVHLWDAKTGKLASFSTIFTFVVAPNGPGLFGDGISFFLAPFHSNIPKNSSGGFLGLFNAETALNAYQNQIVAVEFDSFAGNPWDPESAHIGIDVNSIASATTAKWQTGDVVNGFTAFAFINYEAETKSLSVVVRYPGSHVNGTTSRLSFVIDLRTVLPEWVRVGFSGATGQLVELHKVLSWTFRSSFY